MSEKKQIKILVIGPDSPHVNTFVNRCMSENHIIKVIASGDNRIKGVSVKVMNFSLIKFWNFLLTPVKIKRFTQSFQPDIVCLHQANSFSLYPILGLSKKYPTLLTVWGSDILVAPHQSKWIRKMTLYILKRVTLITADANYLAEQTQALVPKTKLPIHICQFGVEPLNVKAEKENIIYSNRGHYPLYRIESIIKAFERFAQSTKENWKLVIAGSGEQTHSLKTLVSSLDLEKKIEFVGFLSPQQNAEWYARSTFFISIPVSDGTAVSLLEAMYYGCLPIVSDLPANREWITHGKNGWIVNDLSTNFIEDARAVDTQEAITLNKELIEQSGTSDASKKQFLNAITETIAIKSKHRNG